MTAPDDLIRRGDAERAAISYHPADGSCCHEDPTGHHAAVWACDGIAERIRALPADPVAEAAVRFAATTSNPWIVHGKSSDGLTYDGFKCRMCDHAWYPANPRGWPTVESHAEVCPAGIYRAAVAARAKETR